MSKTSYLMRRKGSQNWRIRLQYPGEPVFEKSLRTRDQREAEIIALRDYGEKIAEHKAALLVRRPHVFHNWMTVMEPGREHVAEDGHRIIATERELIHVNPSGTTRAEPNGGMGWTLTTGYPITEGDIQALAAVATGKKPSRPIVVMKNGDDALFETYLQHASIIGYYEREARAVWALYKTLTNSKPLKDATREDGRRLAAHFEGQQIKSATIRKKIGWLVAAVNLAIKDSLLTHNPFSGVVPKRDDAQTRLPLDDADMKAIRSGLDRLDKGDRLLLRMLAATGMRLSEAFEIDCESKERGIRYVIVGRKTKQSKRRVPLPACLRPALPKIIKGRLFDGTESGASKRLNRFLNDVGIVDARKVLHSLRHRAQDRLRAAGCPEDVRWAILGHEEKTVAAGYGEGFPVTLLRQWIDKIGF
jgi:integrase